MTDRINQALTRLFERHRVVFWYDTKKELRRDFEEVVLDRVEKVEVLNNEYALKYRILKEKPEAKFLVFKEGPQPTDVENWLLDVQLSHAEFRTDQIALLLAELELGLEFGDLVENHIEFFQAVKRKEALKRSIDSTDTANHIRLKMLAVCAGSDSRLDAVVESLLQEEADGKDSRIRFIEKCQLSAFLWEQMARSYGYRSSVPSMRDFVVTLFKDSYAAYVKRSADRSISLSADALVFLKRWKDNRHCADGFEKLSHECSEALSIENDLAACDFRDLLSVDIFEKIDRKVLSDLVRAVGLRTVSAADVSAWIWQRRQGHWYAHYADMYEAVDYAAQFFAALAEADLTMDSFSDGVRKYASAWFKVDQLYRKFTYHTRKAGQATLLGSLTEQIDNFYSNHYLLKLGDSFQEFVEGITAWDASPVLRQRDFFARVVRPFISKEVKICVVISDALRYELGEELLSLVKGEDRLTAELEPALAMIPSYTQLGMAALLPHSELLIMRGDSAAVSVDGLSSQGAPAREKILSKNAEYRAKVLDAEVVSGLKIDELREIVRDHDLLYVYHNRIDMTGDKRDSEERVFEAAEDTLKELTQLVKKLGNAHASNILVTADHGFIYQNQELDESDFLGIAPEGEEIVFRSRRFVLGKALVRSSSFHTFTSAQLELGEGLDIQIPKSINRLRLQGAGSRYVHGGASLQEVVIPVLKINRKRQSDVTSVEIDILRGASSIITSGQLGVTMYQCAPVSEKVKPRVVRAGLYTERGELVSDSHELTFDLASENPRDREVQVRLVLTSKADEAKDREVFLRLEEKVAGTSHYVEYKSLRYTVRRSFTSDFDF